MAFLSNNLKAITHRTVRTGLVVVTIAGNVNNMKPVQYGNSHTQNDQKLVFNTNYCLMQVKSIAECWSKVLQNAPRGAFCNAFDLH